MGRFPFTRQHDAAQCGIACLKMVCSHYGKEFTIEELSSFCQISVDGISLKGLSDVASKIGMESIGVRIPLDNFSSSMLPCILHWNKTHFVVLYKITRNKYYIADPAKGLLAYEPEQIFSHCGISSDSNEVIALLLNPTKEFYLEKRQVQTKRFSVKFLIKDLIKYKQYLCQIGLGLIFGSLLQLILPFLMQMIVDIGIKQRDIGFIWLVLLGEFMIVTGRTATDFIRSWLLLHISMRINISLVSNFFIKLFKLPMSFFDSRQIGDLLQRVNDHRRVESFLTNQVLSSVFSILNVVIFGSVLLYYNLQVFTVFAIGSTLYGGWLALFMGKRKLLDYESFEKSAANQNTTYQLLSSMQEIKLQNCETRQRCQWEDSQSELFEVNIKKLRLKQIEGAGSVFINEMKNIIITVLAATAVIEGSMTLGMMLAVQYIIGQLNSPVLQLMQFIYSLQDVKISLERINEIHSMENEQCGLSKQSEMKTAPEITFKNVDFKYDKYSQSKTLDNVNFIIPANKITAIVGTSGSGKTTLLKLILGYYPVSAGNIMIGKSNISEIDIKWWRNQCGVVMQDGIIFSESIAHNIAAGEDDIDMDRVRLASKLACIEGFIMSLPSGYNTKIGRAGMELSKGQKQRILIARAVYKNPPIIILDEATNALDAKNESEIVKNLAEFYKGRTVVIVAHRLSTVRNADQILVIENGCIVEAGTHNKLIKLKGNYYSLIQNQLELGYSDDK